MCTYVFPTSEYQTHSYSQPCVLSVSRAESERNPWVVLTSALLTHCQGSEVKLDLGQQVVNMVRTLYNTKHKLPVQVIIRTYNQNRLLCNCS